MNPNYASFITINESNVLLTYESINGTRHKFNKSKYHENPTNKKYTGTLSNIGKKTIQKRLTAWIYSILIYNKQHKLRGKAAKQYPVMITLTLSAKQNHTDYQIKKRILEPFIKQLQYTNNVKHYFWRAEAQKNGNIHFHMLIDCFIQKKQIQKQWNKAQENLNYITEFESKFGHRQAPSTHIVAMKGVYSPIEYLVKYVAKRKSYRNIEGAQFRFSSKLVNLKVVKTFYEGSAKAKIFNYFKGQIKKTFSGDFFSFSILFKSLTISELPAIVLNIFKTQYLVIYESLYGSPILPELVSVSANVRRPKLYQSDIFQPR